MVRVRTARSAIAAGAAALAVAVALAASAPESASAVVQPIILTAPASAANCTPCHSQIGESRNPDIIFSHAKHILIDCTSCHVAPPHEGGVTVSPPMNTCFACHGLVHGASGELASGECETCHPAAFELRPTSHVETWAAEPHAVASRGGVNPCMLCHEAGPDCDTCHRDEKVEVGPMPPVYLNSIPSPAAQPTITVDPAVPVDIGQCAFCHNDIDDHEVPGLIFGHEVHLERAYECAVCHTAFPHGQEGTKRPPMRDCYRCHGLTHAAQGAVAPGECEACHTPDFELMPPDHTVKFRSGEHKETGEKDAALCATCHTASFCVPCHRGGAPLADGTTSKPVQPANHATAEWISDHGGPYLVGEGLCAICHDSASCTRCHQTKMPHPTSWQTGHADAAGLSSEDCKICHTNRTDCQTCHHASVRSADLVRENCIECHEEMKIEPAVDIKVAQLAEHAVHFDVAETKRGEPYRCTDCHVSFGPLGIKVVNPNTGPHDMRVCYDCHGGVDIQGIQIAPWAGSELCRRCHSDLNI
jgi:hypothetical protein